MKPIGVFWFGGPAEGLRGRAVREIQRCRGPDTRRVGGCANGLPNLKERARLTLAFLASVPVLFVSQRAGDCGFGFRVLKNLQDS